MQPAEDEIPVDFDLQKTQAWIQKTNCMDKDELMQFMQDLKEEHTKGACPISNNLWDAVGAGDITRVEAVLDSIGARDQIDRRSMDWDAQTALHRAASVGYDRIVQILLKRGASVNARDNGGSTPLHMACMNRHLAVVEMLLEKGSAVNGRDTEGQTPLIIASANGSMPLVDLLMKHGAKLSMLDSSGYSALHSACANGHLELTRKFLDSCDPAHVSRADLDGLTPLHGATAGGYVDIVRLLLDSGADVHKKDAEGRTAQDWAEEEFEDECQAILKEHATKHPAPVFVEPTKEGGTSEAGQGADSTSIPAVPPAPIEGSRLEPINSTNNGPEVGDVVKTGKDGRYGNEKKEGEGAAVNEKDTHGIEIQAGGIVSALSGASITANTAGGDEIFLPPQSTTTDMDGLD
jgi:ankyrin repeat protein